VFQTKSSVTWEPPFGTEFSDARSSLPSSVAEVMSAVGSEYDVSSPVPFQVLEAMVVEPCVAKSCSPSGS